MYGFGNTIGRSFHVQAALARSCASGSALTRSRRGLENGEAHRRSGDRLDAAWAIPEDLVDGRAFQRTGLDRTSLEQSCARPVHEVLGQPSGEKPDECDRLLSRLRAGLLGHDELGGLELERLPGRSSLRGVVMLEAEEDCERRRRSRAASRTSGWCRSEGGADQTRPCTRAYASRVSRSSPRRWRRVRSCCVP